MTMQSSLDLLLPSGFSAARRCFVLTFATRGRLGNEAAASAIRDGIGRGLKRFSGCFERPGCNCPYCAVFKPTAPAGFAGNLAPGFILETDGIRRSPEKGDVAHASLLLLGSAAETAPWFLTALLHCGQVGIGYPQARFTVDPAARPRSFTSGDIFKRAARRDEASRCRIRFQTPFILQDGKRRVEELSFPRLIKAVCERLQPNVGHWCGHWMRNTDRQQIVDALVEQANDVEWSYEPGEEVNEVAKTYDGRIIPMGGCTGSVLVNRAASHFWPLLFAGELLHVGELPHLDRGRYSIERWPRGRG